MDWTTGPHSGQGCLHRRLIRILLHKHKPHSEQGLLHLHDQWLHPVTLEKRDPASMHLSSSLSLQNLEH